MDTMALPQFDTEAAAPEHGYRELRCQGFSEWIGGKFVRHACGRVVWAPRQALTCTVCAKASRAAHMREIRAKAKIPTDFGVCPVCQSPLQYSGAERSTRKYCSNEHRQAAYRARQKRGRTKKAKRRSARVGL
jgi:hypothetical protein